MARTGNPFDNLDYAQYIPTFVGMPIDDIKALNIEQEKNYQQFLNDSDVLENTIKGIKPTSEIDKPKLKAAQDDLRGFIDNAVSEGNLKSKGPLLRKYAKSMDETFGLSALQNKEAQKSAALAEMEKRVQEGKLNRQDFETARAAADVLYETSGGLQRNPTTEEWEANWNMYNLSDSINPVDLLIDSSSGKFKANVNPVMKRFDSVSGQYYDAMMDYVPGKGFIYADTQEAVEPERVRAFAMQYLGNDPQFKSHIADQTYLRNVNRFLTREGYREPTIDDLKQIINRTNISNEEMDSLGLTDTTDETLQKAVEKNGGIDNLIRNLDAVDLSNNAIQPFVNLESYSKTDRRFYVDWEEKARLDFEAKRATGAKPGSNTTGDGYIDMLVPITTQQKISPDDMSAKITEWNKVQAQYSDLQSQILKAEKDPTIDKTQLKEKRKELEALAKRSGQLKEQLEFVRNSVISKVGKDVINEIWEKFERSQQFDIDKNEKLLKDFEFSHGKIPESEKQEAEDFLNNKILTKDQFLKLVLDAYTTGNTGTRLRDLITTSSFGSYEEQLALEIKFGTGVLNRKLGKFGSEPIGQQFYAQFDSATMKHSGMKQIINVANQALKADKNVFMDAASGKDLQTLADDILGLKAEQINWDKSTITPLMGVDENGNPLFAVSLYEYADKKNPSKGDHNVGAITVSMTQDSNARSVLADYVSEQMRGILNRGQYGDFNDSYGSNTDLDKFKVLSKFYADLTGIGKELDNVDIYNMNPDDVKVWEIPFNNTTVGLNIRAKREVGGTNVGDLNYYLELNGRTFGTNNQGQWGWWDSSSIAEPKSFDTAAEIKSEIGGAIFKDIVDKEKANNINQGGNGYNPYPTRSQRQGQNISVNLKLSSDMSAEINFNNFNFTSTNTLPNNKQDYANNLSDDIKRGFNSFISSLGLANSEIQINATYAPNSGHSNNSKHYSGNAIDIQAKSSIKKKLGLDQYANITTNTWIYNDGKYRILYEPGRNGSNTNDSGHFHIEVIS